MKHSPFFIDPKALLLLKHVVVAYSEVDRTYFPTQEAYEAELEVVERAQSVVEELKHVGLNAKGFPADEYLLTNLLVDKPDLVINLVDTLKGRDILQTSIPAALDLLQIPYTGAGMQGLLIGNNRNLNKQLLTSSNVPTPPSQYIRRSGTNISHHLKLPLIVKLNESGGSVGIDNDAVKDTYMGAQQQADELIKTYKKPVMVEEFVDGPEITVVVFDDGYKKHVFAAEKIFRFKPDGKHFFTSLESYKIPDSYTYQKINPEWESKVQLNAVKAFNALKHRDYAKFDVRWDSHQSPLFTDSNPNTAFGPRKGLPMTEILELFGMTFQELCMSLLSKHARLIQKNAFQTLTATE